MAGWNVIDMKRRLRSFNVEKQTEKSVKEGAWQIIELNKINLEQGLNRDGKLVGTYSPFTERWARTSKRKHNESKTAGSAFNLNWTGDFINGIFITYGNHKIEFFSKGMGLTKKSFFITSNKLLGISKKYYNIMRNDIIAPRLQTKFKSHLGK